MIAAHHNK